MGTQKTELSTLKPQPSTRSRATVLGIAFLFAAFFHWQAFAVGSTNDLTGPWQLFVDDFPVAAKANVVRTYHPFQKYAGNPVLVPDRPWEGLVYLYGTVLHDESGTGYRMWYHTLRTNNACPEASTELYATSTDGLNWVKPVLNLRTGCGSTSNNMYFTRPTGGGMTSVMHTPWESNPAQRYQFMNFDSGGYWAAWSSNGINLIDAPHNPVFTGGSDVGQFCWDPHTQRYLGYVKNAWYDWNGRKRRAVALTTTTNITTWPRESLILWPDTFDDRWAIPGTVQRTHFYGLSAFPYETMYVGFLWVFRATELDGEMPGYLIGPCFVELVSSHDGVNWTRQEGDRPPILPLGPAGSWDDGMVFTARAPVRVGDALKLWYGGLDQVHGTALTKTRGAIGLATLRKDGFASLDAAAATGTVLTRNLVGAGGPLQVNYQATGGWLKAEVLDENNNVLPGYGQGDCAALTGDSVNEAVTWGTHTELPTSPSVIRLRFILENVSLYSFMAGEAAVIGVPPAIMQQPADQTSRAGGFTGFSLVASGSRPLFYQWQKNDVNLGDGGHYAGCTTSTMTITNTDGADTAGYRCLVTNAYGSVTSHPATLTVMTNVFGSVTLTSIPVASGYAANEARAITPDGRYVVGFHGAFSPSATNGYLYDVATGNLRNSIVTPDGAAAAALTGVGYRTHNGRLELVLDGYSAGWHANFMTTNGGATWGLSRRDTSLGTTPTLPPANSMAGTASDVFHSTWWDVNTSDWQAYVSRYSNTWPASVRWDRKGILKGNEVGMNGISSTGRAAGYRWLNGVATKRNYVLDWNGSGTPTQWFLHGLDGSNEGEAFAVSADGTTIFGRSPASGTVYGYKLEVTTAVPGVQISTNRLPNFPDVAGNNTCCPYGCTADGKYAVGMSYRGLEKAVLWDTRDPNPARWTVLDLTDLAAAHGILSIFTRLSRAYSVGTNAAGAFVIVGVGTDGANTRAFVMTVEPPLAPLAHPPTVAIAGSVAAGFTLSCLSLANATITYYLECMTNLTLPPGWATITSTPGTGGRITLSDPSPTDAQRFYRLRIQ